MSREILEGLIEIHISNRHRVKALQEAIKAIEQLELIRKDLYSKRYCDGNHAELDREVVMNLYSLLKDG